MAPLVSVVIPHFERPELLRAAVTSVLASSFDRVEVVVVDDGSSEECWRAIRSLENGRVSLIRRQEGRKGPSSCRNLGVRACTTERIIFLDSDDVIARWCLEQRLQAAAENPRADFWVFPVLLFRETPGDMDLLWNRMDPVDRAAIRFAQSDPPWHTSSPLWNRSSFEAIGGFNESVFYGDDADLHMRALLSGLHADVRSIALPDVFIRRSAAPRITNTLDADAVESRRVRLREGTRYLKSAGASECLHWWQGQYFVEAEFLLFNYPSPRLPAARVLEDWQREFRLPRHVRGAVRSYFAIALAARRRAYLVLRVARRLVMKILPGEYFPRDGGFQSAAAGSSVIGEVRRRLDNPAYEPSTGQTARH